LSRNRLRLTLPFLMDTRAMPRTALVAFLKYPQPGLVKTRLAQDVGEQAAASFYLEILLGQLEMLRELPPEISVHLHCDPSRPLSDYHHLLDAYPFPLALQKGRSLGERLPHSIEDLIPSHAGVIAMGTDCPSLSLRHVRQTREAIALGSDLVLGPARDGGYYLIGMNRFHPELFENIPWGTREVFAVTRHRARLLDLKVCELEVLRDIDTWEDLKLWTEGKRRTRLPDLLS
jgi:uncharacterized protein